MKEKLSLTEATIKALSGDLDVVTEKANKANAEINKKILNPIANKAELQRSGYNVETTDGITAVKRADRVDDFREIDVFDDGAVFPVTDTDIGEEIKNKEAFDAKNFLDTKRVKEDPKPTKVQRFKNNKETIDQAEQEITDAEVQIKLGNYDKNNATNDIIKPWKKMKDKAEDENNKMLRRTLGEHKVVETIQSTADLVSKIDSALEEIKSGNVETNIYDLTSEIEEEIERNDDESEKQVLTDKLHELNNAYSKICKFECPQCGEIFAKLVDVDTQDLAPEELDRLDVYDGSMVDFKECPTCGYRDEEDSFIIKENKTEDKELLAEKEDDIESQIKNAITKSYNIADVKVDKDKKEITFTTNKGSEDDTYVSATVDFLENVEKATNNAIETSGEGESAFNGKSFTITYENTKKQESAEESFGEDFYEKICRAYIDTMNLEWVTTNPENNNSIVHGYFPDDDTAEKYNSTATPDNFKEIANGDDYYEFETWEDFYEEIVKDNIAYDINDIGLYPSGDVEGDDEDYDFYVSKEDLIKLGLLEENTKLNEEVAVGSPDVVIDDIKEILDLATKASEKWDDLGTLITQGIDEEFNEPTPSDCLRWLVTDLEETIESYGTDDSIIKKTENKKLKENTDELINKYGFKPELVSKSFPDRPFSEALLKLCKNGTLDLQFVINCFVNGLPEETVKKICLSNGIEAHMLNLKDGLDNK